MYQNNLCKCTAIKCQNKINNVAFDGQNYFFTICNSNEIIKWNHCDGVSGSYYTCKEFNCICYDFNEKCFYATVKNLNNTIFKLDHCFNIKCSFNVQNNLLNDCIVALTFDKCLNQIIICTANSVLSFCTKTKKAKILYCTNTECLKGILWIDNKFILTTFSNHNYFIKAYTKCFKEINSCCVDNQVIPITLIHNGNNNCNSKPAIDAFVLKKLRFPYMCQYVLPNNFFNIYDCESDNSSDCNLNCRCNYICNRDNSQNCTDIIKSIALIETSIAHILNAESEKIQRAVSQSYDIEQLLCINHSVNQTITNIISLEHALYDKLRCALNNNF